VFGVGHVRDWLYRSLKQAAASVPSAPNFKVEYGYFLVPSLDCPGGRCEQPHAQRLKVQSLVKGPVAVRDVVVNERPECILNFPTTGLKGVTMEFGDVGYVLSKCEPITVRIETEKGETTYNFN
jgi:hypothetical protein